MTVKERLIGTSWQLKEKVMVREFWMKVLYSQRVESLLFSIN